MNILFWHIIISGRMTAIQDLCFISSYFKYKTKKYEGNACFCLNKQGRCAIKFVKHYRS